MDIYYIALACWLSGAFLCGLWATNNTQPLHSGFYIIAGRPYPLYHYNNTWRTCVPGGPWIYPSWPELIAYAETENGDPLIEE